MLQMIAYLAIGGIVYLFCGMDAVKTLNWLTALFTAYMLVRVVIVYSLIPDKIYDYPDTIKPHFAVLPDVISKDNVSEILIGKNRYICYGKSLLAYDLLDQLKTKIQCSSDELVVYEYYRMRLQSVRQQFMNDFLKVDTELTILSFEGIIGTLLGLITFLAQSTLLFNISRGSADTMLDSLIYNISSINLLVVSLAFLTSIIGWCAKAYLGRTIEERKNQLFEFVDAVDSVFQTMFFSRLTLAGQKMVILSEETDITQGLVHELGRLLNGIAFKTKLVQDGMVWQAEPRKDSNITFPVTEPPSEEVHTLDEVSSNGGNGIHSHTPTMDTGVA